MLKKILYLILVLNFLPSCGYTPMYSSGKLVKFSIDEIIINGDWELNNFIKNSLERYSSKEEAKKYKIIINTNYTENAISRDAAGKTTKYQFIIDADIELISEDFNKKYSFKESFTMENFNDELDKTNYEKSNKNNISNIIVNKLVLQISRLE